MQATAFAQRIAETACTVERELAECWQDLKTLNEPAHPELRIATQCYTTYRWLPFVIREMRNEFPELNIDVLPDATENPYQALADERIDMALVFHPESGPHVKATPLFEDELFAVMHKDHPLATRHYLNARNFEDETLVLYTGDKHAILEEHLKPAGVSVKRIMQLRMTEAIVELVRAGHGIAVLSGWAFDDIDNKYELRAVRISKSGFIRQWLAISRATDETPTPHYQQRFIELMSRLGAILHQQKWRRALRKHGSISS